MNVDFFAALKEMGVDNGISPEQLAEIIKQGIVKAIKKENPNCDNIRCEINPDTGVFEMGILKLVVDDEPLDDYNEINIEQARIIDPRCHVGGMCLIAVSPATFGRVAVQNAKQQIKHELKNFEREKIIEQLEGKTYECITARVERIDGKTGNALLSVDKNEIYLVHKEQIPGEILCPGDLIKVYVVGIANPEKKPTLKISRTHKNLVKRLFENEVPEIHDGIVEIMGISRVAGSRSKIAVKSKDPNVDAVGACIGPRKSRISAVVSELRGEKIDIIPYSEDIEEFIARALAPAQVISVKVTEGTETPECKVIVPANQLSLAIGNKGQNAKLAAGLTGFKIDIMSDKQAEEIAAQIAEEDAAIMTEDAGTLMMDDDDALLLNDEAEETVAPETAPEAETAGQTVSSEADSEE